MATPSVYSTATEDGESTDIVRDDLDAKMEDSIEENPFQRETNVETLSYGISWSSLPVESQNNKGFIDRNFSGLSKGGIRSSLFTMFSGTMGAGLLSLPNVFSYYGFVLGCVIIVIFGLVTYQMYRILNELIIDSKKKSYANVVAHYLGKVSFEDLSYRLLQSSSSSS